MANPPQLPQYIYGLHDVGGQELMLASETPGWILDTIDLRSQVGTDYSSLAQAGLSLIVRLNYGYDRAGTIPPSSQYDAFAQLCATYVRNSSGARIWIIGNEMNASTEWPQLEDGTREVITPEKYARCFYKCRSAIKKLPGHANDWVLPGAVRPYNNETTYPNNPDGDWILYLVDVLSLLVGQVDGIALHCYTHDFVADQISDDLMMTAPFSRRHYNFRTYRDFLKALPERLRSLPVLITETNPIEGWRDTNNGWITSAYQEIAEWNSIPGNQAIQALCVFRWQSQEDHPEWGLQDKPALLDDFNNALAAGWRVPPSGVSRKGAPRPTPAHHSKSTKSLKLQVSPVSIAQPPSAPEALVSSAPSAKPSSAPSRPASTPSVAAVPELRVQWIQAPVIPNNSMAANSVLTGRVVIKNVGKMTWVADGPTPVRLGYHWYNERGVETPVAPYAGNWPLSRDIGPGDTAVFDNVELRAPQWDGTYQLKWDVVQEGVTWFGSQSSPTLDALVQVGSVVAASVPARMSTPIAVMPTTPPNQSKGGWAASVLAHDTPISMVVGQTASVNLRIKNVGTNVWPKKGNPQVHIGYKWINFAGAQQLDVQDLRTALPADMRVQEEKSFGAFLAAPDTPGLYHLRWDVVVEGVTWFSDVGGAPLTVPVSVTAVPRETTLWRLESNLNSAQVALALDGDPRTAWDSLALQASGHWFRLNLSSPRIVDGIQFLSPGKGFPSAFCLRVSPDGQTWTVVAEAASDNVYDVMAIFAPLSVQYIQIDLTGAPATPENWLISEVLLHQTHAWTVSASHNSAEAGLAVDNRSDTAWNSRVPQAPGMWFQVDLGRVETISGLTLFPSAGEHASGYRVATWDVSGNRWDIAYENPNNLGTVDVTFKPTQTQYVNIQLLQASDKPWSIRELRLVREMDSWLRPSTQRE